MKKIMNERLEHLLEAKSFSQLNAEERYFVTEIMDETEYERMRFLVKNGRPILQDTPSPNPAIRENLLAAMRQMKTEPAPTKPQGIIVRLLRARIPAWQAAAAVALLLGFHFFQKAEPIVVERTVTEYVNTVDTIYKEVAVQAEKTPPVQPAIRINVKPTELPQPDQLEPEIIAQADSSVRPALRTELPDTFALTVSHPRGQSAKQTEDLWQFLGEVY